MKPSHEPCRAERRLSDGLASVAAAAKLIERDAGRTIYFFARDIGRHRRLTETPCINEAGADAARGKLISHKRGLAAFGIERGEDIDGHASPPNAIRGKC